MVQNVLYQKRSSLISRKNLFQTFYHLWVVGAFILLLSCKTVHCDITISWEMHEHVRYQPVHQIKYRPNKENGWKKPTSLTKN